MENKFDAIIVGGGLSGLLTASLLTHRGLACCVVESQSAPGGRARSDMRRGFNLDFGIHCLRGASQGAIPVQFARLGIPLRVVPLGHARLFLQGKMNRFPEGLPGILSTPLLSARAKFGALSRFVGVALHRFDPALYDLSVEEWLRNNKLDEPDIQELIHIICGAGMICPDISRASFGELLQFLKHALGARHSVGYPIGGWRGLIGRLASMVQARGSLRLGERVHRVLYDGDRAAGVVVSGGEIHARCVILAVPPADVAPLAGPDAFDDAVRDRIASIEPTAGIACDFALSRRVSPIDGVIFSSEPMTMGFFVSNVDSSVAPRGAQLGSWFYPLPANRMDDKAFVQKEKSRLKNLIADMFPDVWKRLEFERTMALRIVDGAVPALGQTRLRRPAADCAKIDNLFLAGDWIGVDGYGGDMAANSAAACADAAAAWLKSAS